MPIPHSLRSLARSPGLALAVIGMLGAGIGALTATFGLVDAAILRPPPFSDPNRLAIAYLTRTRGEAVSRERWSLARVRMLRQLSTTLASVANYSRAELVLTGSNNPEPVAAEVVSPEYFATLGATPLHGRTFATTEDGAAGAHPVALLGYELWRRRYAADPRVVGSTVGVNGVALTVLGVMPRGFRGLTDRAELWVPTAMAPRLSYADYLSTNQSFISAVVRLRPGSTLERVRSELAVVGAKLGSALPPESLDSAQRVGATVVPLNQARLAAGTKRSVLLLLAAVGLLHLLAIANVASLLLGRVAARWRELAVRAAIGCGPRRLFGQLFGETALLTAIGGAVGLVLAWAASRAISVPSDLFAPQNFYGSLAAFDQPALDGRVAGFAVVLTVLTALVVAWVPAAAALSGRLLEGLREGGRGLARGAVTLKRLTLRGGIVAVEAALAVILLAGGGLMIQSFVRMRNTRLGIDPDRVLTFVLRPSEVRVPPAAAPAFLTRVLDAIHLVPGVEAATVDGCAPLSTVCANTSLHVVGREVAEGQEPAVLRHYVAPEHFKVLGIPLLEGRSFTREDDVAHPRVVIVNQAAARRFWPAGNAVGQRVWFGAGGGFYSADSTAEVVGVVGDVAYQPLDQRPFQPDFYTPYTQFTYASRMVLVRTAGDPAGVVIALRAVVRSVEPELPLFDVQTLRDRLGGSWSKQRFNALLLGGFAAVALLLAASGIYGVVAYAVSQRTREMGIRLALGATPGAVLGLVVREGMALPLAGMVAGSAAALGLTRALRASLYEVTPTDPGVFGATLGLMLLVAALACLVPGRRATRADPLEALRAE
jgi:putative ABC transport system permease protein